VSEDRITRHSFIGEISTRSAPGAGFPASGKSFYTLAKQTLLSRMNPQILGTCKSFKMQSDAMRPKESVVAASLIFKRFTRSEDLGDSFAIAKLLC